MKSEEAWKFSHVYRTCAVSEIGSTLTAYVCKSHVGLLLLHD